MDITIGTKHPKTGVVSSSSASTRCCWLHAVCAGIHFVCIPCLYACFVVCVYVPPCFVSRRACMYVCACVCCMCVCVCVLCVCVCVCVLYACMHVCACMVVCACVHACTAFFKFWYYLAKPRALVSKVPAFFYSGYQQTASFADALIRMDSFQKIVTVRACLC